LWYGMFIRKLNSVTKYKVVSDLNASRWFYNGAACLTSRCFSNCLEKTRSVTENCQWLFRFFLMVVNLRPIVHKKAAAFKFFLRLKWSILMQILRVYWITSVALVILNEKIICRSYTMWEDYQFNLHVEIDKKGQVSLISLVRKKPNKKRQKKLMIFMRY